MSDTAERLKALLYELDGITTIEILPLDLTDISQELLDQATEQDPTFILVQGNLGIFRKSLLKLYLRTSMRLAELSELPSHEAIRGTFLLLLANPGHSTALNARVRLVESGALSLSYELRWVSLLLLSSKEASKQSILWAYRRRLLVGLAEVFLPRLSSLAAEVSLVLNVCGMYPRNYYAWNHLYLCLEPCILSVDLPEIEPLVEQLDRLKDWVQTHVSDYSAAHHYCCLTAKAQTTKFASSYGIHTLKGIKEHSLSLVRSFPSHESLWMYLRIAVQVQVPDERTQTIRELREELGNYKTQSEYARKLFLWFDFLEGRTDLPCLQ